MTASTVIFNKFFDAGKIQNILRNLHIRCWNLQSVTVLMRIAITNWIHLRVVDGKSVQRRWNRRVRRWCVFFVV